MIYRKSPTQTREEPFMVTGAWTLHGWDEFVRTFYRDLSADATATYLRSYETNGWGLTYIAVFVACQDADPVKRLKRHQGAYSSYQQEPEDTLRGEFGLDQSRNLAASDKLLVFNGIHAVKDEDEMKKTLEFLASCSGAQPLDCSA